MGTMTLGNETQVALCLYQGSTMVSNLEGCYFPCTVNEHTMEKSEILLTKKGCKWVYGVLQMVFTYVIHLRIYSGHAEIMGKFSHLRLTPKTHYPNLGDKERKYIFPLIYILAKLFTSLSFSPMRMHFPEVDKLTRSTPRLLWMILLTNFCTCVMYLNGSTLQEIEKSNIF